MKKKPTLLLFLLSMLCALLLPLTSAFGATTVLPAQANLNSEISPAMIPATVNQEGAVFTEIVVGQTNLQDVTLADAANTMIALDTSGAGSGAQLFANVQPLVDDTVNVSSGGNSFHAGKYFASAGTDMRTISLDKPADAANFNEGGSPFHVGKHFAPSLHAAAVLIIT